MGNRRFSRKRLFEVEKRGQPIDLGSGAGIAGAVARATQHRQGQEIITEIVMDLGVASHAIVAGGGAGNAVGVLNTDSHIAKLTVAEYGIVSEVRAVCVEACSRDVDVVLSATDNTIQGGTPGSQTSVLAGATTAGKDNSADLDAGTVFNLYIVDGDGTGDEAAINDGKLLIYVHGFVAPADLA